MALSPLRIVLVSLLPFAAGCNTVPITGRSQLSLIPDATVLARANQSHTAFMSAASKNNAVLSEDDSKAAAETVKAVKRVADRIIDAAGLRDKYAWEINVIKSKEMNAFVLPNGKITVYTGILPAAKNDAGLAAILGHEVAHVVARHGAERMSQNVLMKSVLAAADVAVRGNAQAASISAALGVGAQYGVLMPFSRQHESEADYIGLLYMAKAGYDPAEAVGVWERMAAASKSSSLEMLSTHPSHGTRIENLTKWQTDARPYYVNRDLPLPTNLAAAGIAAPATTPATRSASIRPAPSNSVPIKAVPIDSVPNSPAPASPGAAALAPHSFKADAGALMH